MFWVLLPLSVHSFHLSKDGQTPRVKVRNKSLKVPLCQLMTARSRPEQSVTPTAKALQKTARPELLF